jgi:hypothetical protein
MGCNEIKDDGACALAQVRLLDQVTWLTLHNITVHAPCNEDR